MLRLTLAGTIFILAAQATGTQDGMIYSESGNLKSNLSSEEVW